MRRVLAVLAVTLVSIGFAQTNRLPNIKGSVLSFKGDLLTMRAEGETTLLSEAESCFHHAIEIARAQPAKSFELRAVMSLSRLYYQQGNKEQAREILAEI